MVLQLSEPFLSVTFGQDPRVPQITGISRKTASIAGGEIISLFGKNFLPGTKLFLGDREVLTFRFKSPTELEFEVPRQFWVGRRLFTVFNAFGRAQTEVEITSAPLRQLGDSEIMTVAGGMRAPVVGGNLSTRPRVRLSPQKLIIDQKGNLCFLNGHSELNRIDAISEIITTIIGNHFYPDSVPFGPIPAYSGGDALLTPIYASDLAQDPEGNLYVAETILHGSGQPGDGYFKLGFILRVDAVTGKITVVAGSSRPTAPSNLENVSPLEVRISPGSMAFDTGGNLYFTDRRTVRCLNRKTGLMSRVAGNGNPQGDSGDGGPATEARLGQPGSLAFDPEGNLLIADFELNRVRRVDQRTGIISTLVGLSKPGELQDGTATEGGFSGDGEAAAYAKVNGPISIACDRQGNIYIADFGNDRVRRIDALTGIITSVAGNGNPDHSSGVDLGDGNPATGAQLYRPEGVAIDPQGNLVIADTLNGRIRRVDRQTGIITTIAGGSTQPLPDENRLATSFGFGDITDIGTDGNENLFILCDKGRDVIRVDALTGTVKTVASFIQGTALAVDRDGNIYCSEADGQILRIDAQTRAVIAFPTNLKHITGLTCHPNGTLLIANGALWSLDITQGTLRQIGGSQEAESENADNIPVQKAQFRATDVALDHLGNLYIADQHFHRIRRIDAQLKFISTIGGNGNPGFSGDGGLAVQAALGEVHSLGVDFLGNLYFSDHSRVRVIDSRTGIITTLAGNGGLLSLITRQGDVGEYDLGLARESSFHSEAITVTPGGNVLIADSRWRVRLTKGIANRSLE